MNKVFNSKNLSVIDFLTKEAYYDRELWAEFVNQYRVRDDVSRCTWRGEYWGKSMRGAAMIYSYSKDEKLYEILTETVNNMLTTQDEYNRFSTYTVEGEYRYWDVWCRKYVLLGFEYYYDICKDEDLKKEILNALCKHTDYLLNTIGEGEGKKDITETSSAHQGLNSSSILEPIVKLYQLTREQKYLDFASYIVKRGGTKTFNIVEKALKNEVAPYEYGVSKAYEMMSFIDGLCEYYYVTGDEKCKTAAINFGKKVIETEVTVIGCCGTTHELFDFSAARQTVPYDDVQQETCVTVTWMRLCDKLYNLSEEAIFAEQIEKSYYNAYLGAVNINKNYARNLDRILRFNPVEGVEEVKPSFLPFDSYSPLLVGKRGEKTGGGLAFRDGTYYGCCACIGGAGVGTFINSVLAKKENEIIVNQYINGNISDDDFDIEFITNYPIENNVKISFSCKNNKTIKFRIPLWSKETNIKADFKYEIRDNYLIADLNSGDYSFEIEFDFSVYAHYPMKWDEATIYMVDWSASTGYSPLKVKHSAENDNCICLTRGPIVLGADSRLGKDAGSIFRPIIENGKAVATNNEIDFDCDVCQSIKAEDGTSFTLIDYKSCGKDWQSDMAAWLKTE